MFLLPIIPLPSLFDLGLFSYKLSYALGNFVSKPAVRKVLITGTIIAIAVGTGIYFDTEILEGLSLFGSELWDLFVATGEFVWKTIVFAGKCLLVLVFAAFGSGKPTKNTSTLKSSNDCDSDDDDYDIDDYLEDYEDKPSTLKF